MRQKISGIKLELFPETKYSFGVDGLKNTQIYGMNEEEHNSFCYKIEGDADTGLSDYEQPVDEDQAMIFKHPHGLVTAGECIRSYYERIKQSDVTSMYDYAIYLMHRLYEDFSYKSCTTDVNTSAEEAFMQGYGVCQDYFLCIQSP